MKKTTFKRELQITGTQRRNGNANKKADVRKIQSWLTLYSMWNPDSGTATEIDGDFGPATEKAVKNFQKSKNLSQTGIVTKSVFDSLCANMRSAFESPLRSNDLRDLVVEVAMQHLREHPFELVIRGQSNSGPWVRSYMDGNEGEQWPWCMGFVQTVVDQASSALGKNYTSLMRRTYSCDTVGNIGVEKGILSRHTAVRRDPSLIKHGDIFLIQKRTWDWVHTGIVVGISGGMIETVEGNTNNAGSRNGFAVMKRIRNFMNSKIDFFSIDPLID